MIGNEMDFSKALYALLDGHKIRNTEWNHEGSYLEIQKPDENSKMTLPYIVFNKECDEGFIRVPWVASQFDLLRGRWIVLPE